MSLTRVPPTPALPHPGEPFVVYAIWAEDPRGRWFDPSTATEYPCANIVLKFAAANLPGAALGEFAVSGAPAIPLAQVHPEELPIALTLELAEVDGHGEWRLAYLGSAEDFSSIWQIPGAVQPNAPTPMLPSELNQGAQDMLRESLGLPPDQPIPEPAGRLDGEEVGEEPYRFDPVRHMDLSMAESAPALPPPKAPGPDPAPGAQEFFAPPIPDPQDKRHGAYGDESIPFAH